jgi:hypothetical protein
MFRNLRDLWFIHFILLLKMQQDSLEMEFNVFYTWMLILFNFFIKVFKCLSWNNIHSRVYNFFHVMSQP